MCSPPATAGAAMLNVPTRWVQPLRPGTPAGIVSEYFANAITITTTKATATQQNPEAKPRGKSMTPVIATPPPMIAPPNQDAHPRAQLTSAFEHPRLPLGEAWSTHERHSWTLGAPMSATHGGLEHQ